VKKHISLLLVCSFFLFGFSPIFSGPKRMVVGGGAGGGSGGPAVVFGGWDPLKTSALIELSGTYNETAVTKNNTYPKSTIGAVGITSGKRYFEIYITGRTSVPTFGFGICGPNTTSTDNAGHTADSWSWNGDSHAWSNNTQGVNIYGIAASVVYGVAVDKANGRIWFARGGTWRNSGDPANGTNAIMTDAGIASATVLYPHFSVANSWNGGILRQTTAEFTYAPPSGFAAWYP
jgi:hypothetical protein